MKFTRIHTPAQRCLRVQTFELKKVFCRENFTKQTRLTFTAGEIALPVLKQQKRTRTLHDAFVIRNV